MSRAYAARLSVAMETAGMGFFATARGMVECLRAEQATASFSGVRPVLPKASQAATPCAKGSMPASGAVNDNASEALASAGAGQHVPLGGDSSGSPDPLSLTCGDAKSTGHPQAARGASFPES